MKTGRLRRFMIGFFLVAMGIAGTGFSIKLVEFADDLTSQKGLAFAGSHLLTYGLVAFGFLALLALCFFAGHFRDIEEPKNDLLEKERLHDARLPRLS
jgi:hypothetical protein